MFKKRKNETIPPASDTDSAEFEEAKSEFDIKLEESSKSNIKEMPKFLRHFYCPYIVEGSYILAVVFLLLTSLNIYLAWVLLNMGYTRSAQIYMGFQIILLMPFIPLITGTIFYSRFLIVPFMSGLAITTVLHVLWLLFLLFGFDASLNEDFYIENVTTRTIVISVWSACAIFSAFSFIMILVLWYAIGARLSIHHDGEKHALYPIRRFGTIRSSCECFYYLAQSLGVFFFMRRDDESVVYAYKSGNTEIFYHQAANGSVAGLPPPADLMGTASNKARGRLERDQAVILL